MGAPWAPQSLLWAVLLLGWWPSALLASSPRPCGSASVSHTQLFVPEGGSVSLTCSFPCESGKLQLNWYRWEPGNQTKLAALPREASSKDPHFSISQLPFHDHRFQVSLEGARHNHSGLYLCGAIRLPPTAPGVIESPRINLTVTERLEPTPTPRPQPTPRPSGHSQGLVAGVSSVLGAVLLLLLAWLLVTGLPAASQGACVTKKRDSSLEDTPAPVACTVDYGQLDFEWREKTPEPPAPCVPEPTEYATIVFPGPGSLGGGSVGVLALSQQDRQCSQDGPHSWPL